MADITYDQLQELLIDLSEEDSEHIRVLFRQNQALVENNQVVRRQIDTLSREKYELTKRLADVDNLQGREAKLEDGTRNLELMFLRKDLECERRVTSSYLELMRLAFKSPVIKESIYKSGQEYISQPGNPYQMSVPVSESTTKTVEVE